MTLLIYKFLQFRKEVAKGLFGSELAKLLLSKRDTFSPGHSCTESNSRLCMVNVSIMHMEKKETKVS